MPRRPACPPVPTAGGRPTSPGVRGERLRRHAALSVAAGALLALLAPAPSASAEVHPVTVSAPARSWATTGNPYVFAIGDSVMNGCVLDTRSGGGLGLGYRDLGHITWPGADTSLMRARLQGLGSWPEWTVSEDSNQAEQVWFRDAGALLVALGTNDVRRLTLDEYADNVRWFLEQAHGRPVLWVTSHDPVTEDLLDTFNARLRQIAAGARNLKVVEWDELVDAHPEYVRGDGVHPADGPACDAYDGLLAAAAPGVPGDDGPRGAWSPALRSDRTARYVLVRGWASAWSSPRQDVPVVQVEVDGRPYAQVPVQATDAHGDPLGEAASGRAWALRLPLTAVGHRVCISAADPEGRTLPLGCRYP